MRKLLHVAVVTFAFSLAAAIILVEAVRGCGGSRSDDTRAVDD